MSSSRPVMVLCPYLERGVGTSCLPCGLFCILLRTGLASERTT